MPPVMSMDEIRELLELFNASGVGELEIERKGTRIRIRKAGMVPEYTLTPAGAPQETIASQEAAAGAAGTKLAAGESDPSLIQVKSPIVGTYYEAEKPGNPPFVSVGDAVEPGQVLCIIESMKLMNKIESETAGVVAAKLVENGRPVEYGAPLFSIRPR